MKLCVTIHPVQRQCFKERTMFWLHDIDIDSKELQHEGVDCERATGKVDVVCAAARAPCFWTTSRKLRG